MKRLLPLGILFFAFANQGISQITITKSDMPQPSDTLRLSTTTDSTGLPTPALTGAGATWNYSTLAYQTQKVDTFLSVSYPPIPLAYLLFFDNGFLYPAYQATVAQPGANLPTLMGITISDVINFYKDQTSNYESVGYGATVNNVPTSVKDDTIDVVYEFPMNYGNKDSSHSSNGVSIPSLAYYGTHQYRVNHVDGWGTITTPFGTFSALRVKTLIYTSDTIYVNALSLGFKIPQPQQTQYKWLANGQHVPVLEIDETGTGALATRQYVYRDSARKSLTGIAGIISPLKNVSLYPDPAKENTTLSYSLANSSTVNITIYSVDGRCVSKVFNGEQSTGPHSMTVDISTLQTGIYLLKIESGSGQVVRKLVVAR